jgi:hypothetical protein
LDQIPREQMIAEFGEPGVQNPMIVDLISFDAETNTVILTMTEKRPWGAVPEQFKQIEEKVNRYMGYALDGFLVEHYPRYKGKFVRIRLDCAEAPHGEAVRFVAAMAHAIEGHGLEFGVTIIAPPS